MGGDMCTYYIYMYSFIHVHRIQQLDSLGISYHDEGKKAEEEDEKKKKKNKIGRDACLPPSFSSIQLWSVGWGHNCFSKVKKLKIKNKKRIAKT